MNILLLMGIIPVFYSCDRVDPAEPVDSAEYEYHVPEVTDDGWETASLSDVGIDEQGITEFVQFLLDNTETQMIHSFLLVKGGRLVLDEYFSGYSRMVKHEVQSASKSFRSALIGIAIANGFIEGVEKKLFDFFPDYADLKTPAKDEVLLKHVLTMSSGLDWDEWDAPYPDNDLGGMYSSADRIRYVLSKSIRDVPGTRWYYNSGATMLLTDIITRTTGMAADVFADEYLYRPMQMETHAGISTAYPLGDGMRPRDMAKFGFLFLNNGVWRGNRIIPRDWVRDSFTPHMSTGVPAPLWETSYGYLWWQGIDHIAGTEVQAYFALGNGGQIIGVFPDLDLVAVFTGGAFDNPNRPVQLLRDRIIPLLIQD